MATVGLGWGHCRHLYTLTVESRFHLYYFISILGGRESYERDFAWALFVNWHRKSKGSLSSCEFPAYLLSCCTLSFSTRWVGLISACCSRTGRWVRITGSRLMLLTVKCWRNLEKQTQCYYVTISSLASMCSFTWETPYPTAKKETLERFTLENKIVSDVITT